MSVAWDDFDASLVGPMAWTFSAKFMTLKPFPVGPQGRGQLENISLSIKTLVWVLSSGRKHMTTLKSLGEWNILVIYRIILWQSVVLEHMRTDLSIYYLNPGILDSPTTVNVDMSSIPVCSLFCHSLPPSLCPSLLPSLLSLVLPL